MLAFAPDRGQAVSHRGKRLRQVPAPFVVAPPSGARVRTRLAVNDNDEMVLKALGAHLGHLASLDLARRVAEGSLDAKGKAKSRQARQQALTAASSSRWAGAITRTSEDAYGLAKRNLQAQQVSLRARVDKITKRVALGPGEAKERLVGYASASERWEKQRRVQVLRSRLADVEAQLAIGTLSVCRGGKRRARAPVLRMAYHWFGLAPQHVAVDGERPDLHRELRGAHASPWWRALGLLSDPVYVYLSQGGRVFVPALDAAAFPSRQPIGAGLRALQWATQRAFGLWPPGPAPPSRRRARR